MANEHTAFWLTLLDQGRDAKQRTRLWNGYLNWKLPPRRKRDEPRPDWPSSVVNSPDGGWPVLTREEQERLDTLAEAHGGHPTAARGWSMDFSGHTFAD